MFSRLSFLQGSLLFWCLTSVSFGQITLRTRVIEAPPAFREGAFRQTRSLDIPVGFRISVAARVSKARFLRPLPNGAFLVSQPSAGRIVLVQPDGATKTLIDGLRNPQGMELHSAGGKSQLYVSESNQISRFTLSGDYQQAADKTVIVSNLPDSSSPELRGAYGHELKNLTIGPDNKLYVDIASSSNADPRDTTSDPVRCAIYQFDLDGRNRRLLARGIRNAEGLAFVPGTNQLWAAVNGRDDLRFPYHKSWTGSRSDDYGRHITSYIDDHPPDQFLQIKPGADYGWPFANPNPDGPSGLDDMPLDPDYDTNPNWSRFPVSRFTRTDKGIPAHSAVLGIAFLQNTNVPELIRNGVVMAYHGSWDRSRKTGYKVVFFAWKNGRPGPQVDLVSGWLNEETQNVWGRPVDVKPAEDGTLLISDDYSGTVYRLAGDGPR
jgi:glucose/arabinose dehydrogenase